MVEVLTPLADEIIITEVNMPRRLEAESLERIVNKYNNNTLIEKKYRKKPLKGLLIKLIKMI